MTDTGPAPPAPRGAQLSAPGEIPLAARKPWVLIDRVLAIENDSIRCLKYVTASDFFLVGHFPSRSVYPGVMLVTALTQAAELLVRSRAPHAAPSLRLSHITIHLRATATPGDALVIDVSCLDQLRFRGEIRREADIIARGTLTLVPDHPTASSEQKPDGLQYQQA